MWKSESERHHDALIEAIAHAARHISTAITQGFAHMADAQTAALADLTSAVTNLADAIAGEIAALQAALSASSQPDDSGQIETVVTNLNNLTASLKASVTPASPAPVTPPSPSPSPAAPPTT